MNDIERAVGDLNKVWLAGFRAGVEAAVKELMRQGNVPPSLHERYCDGWNDAKESYAEVIRSLLNESGAAEKEKA